VIQKTPFGFNAGAVLRRQVFVPGAFKRGQKVPVRLPQALVFLEDILFRSLAEDFLLFVERLSFL